MNSGIALEREPAAHDFRRDFDLARVFVDRDDRQHDAVFGDHAAVADHHVAHHFAHRAGIDADAAHRDAARPCARRADRIRARRRFPE